MYPAQRIAVIGAGSWGTALALVAAARPSSDGTPRTVTLWGHRPEHIATLCATRENQPYLPGFRLPENILPMAGLAAALDGAQIVLLVVPSHVTRSVLMAMRPYITPTMVFVSATKGIETDTLMRMSEVAFDVWHDLFEPRYVTLSGPNFAYEVAKGDPTATVVAAFAPRWGSMSRANSVRPTSACTTTRTSPASRLPARQRTSLPWRPASWWGWVLATTPSSRSSPADWRK